MSTFKLVSVSGGDCGGRREEEEKKLVPITGSSRGRTRKEGRKRKGVCLTIHFSPQDVLFIRLGPK